MNAIHENLVDLLGIEPVVVLTLSCFVTLFIYQFLMKKVNASRHALMKRLFAELFRTFIVFAVFWGIQFAIQKQFLFLDKFFLYFGIATVILGSFVFIRAVKIFVFQYLFLNSQKVGVPVLLVNLVTLILSMFIAAWLSTSVFGVRWAPLLATSAIVSVVLGLALQDTLGNLFAGVALQFDKPYEIGDWVEVHTEEQTYLGEVFEITWRATVLYGMLDEVITLPNRLVAQSEVSNFAGRRRPIFRALSVYLDARADEVKVKQIFHQVLKETRGVLTEPGSLVMLRELNEKGAHWRLAYPIVHYSKQYRIVDEILMRAQAEFKKNGIFLARFRIEAEPAE
jgi:small-conductance mechanosensitive channel